MNHHPSIEFASYTVDVSTKNDTALMGDILSTLASGTAAGGTTLLPSNINSGSFYVGLDLENYANSDKSQIFAGWNSSTDDIYYIPTFAANTAATARFDAFAIFDSLLVFENNTCYVKY